jgi:erythromycin esterase-like protein
MGAHLAKALGERYLAIGTSFYEGGFLAWDGQLSKSMKIVDCLVPPPPPYFIDATLAKAVSTPIFLDLRTKPVPPAVARWWAVPRPFRTYGAVYTGTGSDGSLWPILIWRDLFDGLIQVPRTNPARLLPSSAS